MRADYSPGQLARLLGLPEPTAEQAAVIGAPLAADGGHRRGGLGQERDHGGQAGVAGRQRRGPAGTGAGPDVHPEGRRRTRRAGADPARRAAQAGRPDAGPPALGAPAEAPPGTDAELDGEPVMSTYHAYAARLVGDHALREALEPTLRLITPAVSWQLAARVVAGYGGPMDAVDLDAARGHRGGPHARRRTGRAPADARRRDGVGNWLAGRRGPAREAARRGAQDPG